MLQESIEINFIKRLDRGVYIINPFIFKSKGCSNQTIERLQKEWLSPIFRDPLNPIKQQSKQKT